MERKPVESSNILSVGYDPDTQTLEVEFKRGQVYSYKNVEETTHMALMKAESKGRYFEQHIKTHYPFNRI